MANAAVPYSAHIGYLFTELPFEKRIEAAKQHGFSAVEYPAPYDTSASEMADLLADAGLPYVQFGLRSGDAARGEKGLAIFPERKEEFRASVEEGLTYAETINVRLLHTMAGVLPKSERTPDHWRQYIENLSYVADAAEQRGVTVLVEPMCQQAVSDYFIQTPDQAAEAIAATGRKNIRLLFDVFHTVSAGLDLFAQIAKHGRLIGHVHVSDFPGRHEPGSGTLDFARLDMAFREIGYCGSLGCEYVPRAGTIEGLAWLAGAQSGED
ncbi:MAG TPA: TIM barrel protein [Granulicella sp.]|jgi:hydroxypyruvate isomerase|nr:TIM barrel protein [Granulicella sp.]